MWNAIVYGFGTGIFLSVGFGSIFFALIQDSLTYNYKAGMQIALGVCIGESLLICIALLGTNYLPDIPNFGVYARVFGILLLLSMAAFQVFSKPFTPSDKNYKLPRYFVFMGKGFLLNVFNPVNFISWVVVATTLKNLKYTNSQIVVFFGIALLMIFVCEALISLFADKVKKWFSESVIKNFKYLTASMFVIISLKLLYDILK